MHLRPPSIDRGVISAAWAIGLALFLFFGMWSVGVSPGIAFVLSAVAGGAIFLFVRINGEPDPPRRQA
jgi:ABC-type Fe3+-siderophore transport system permease subunit